MMRNRIFAACLFVFLGFASAKGTVNIVFNVDSVYDANGLPVPVTGLGLIIADTTGDGFGAINTGSLLAGALIGSSDLILYRADFSMADGVTPGIWSEAAFGLALSGAWTQGDALAFVWFPTLGISSLASSSGDAYGSATFSGWITPADGTSVTYQLISSTNNGLFTPSLAFPTRQLPDEQLRAGLTVTAVPEPAALSLTLSVVALAGVFAVRGRRGAAKPGCA